MYYYTDGTNYWCLKKTVDNYEEIKDLKLTEITKEQYYQAIQQQ